MNDKADSQSTQLQTRIAREDTIRTQHAKAELKIYNLKQLNKKHSINVLKQKLNEKEITSKTAATMVTYWNRVAEYACKPDLYISAKEYGLNAGGFSYTDRTVSKESHRAFVSYLEEQYQLTGDIRYKALKLSVELQRELGLRASESFCIKLAEKDISNEKLHLDRKDDTKNGRERDVPIWKPSQKEKLEEAQRFVKEQGWTSLIPPEYTKSQWISFTYGTVVEFKNKVPEHREYHFHGERHAFAQEYYQHLKEQRLEEKIRESEDKALALTRDEEREIRKEVSEALGHSREEITWTYIGK